MQYTKHVLYTACGFTFACLLGLLGELEQYIQITVPPLRHTRKDLCQTIECVHVCTRSEAADFFHLADEAVRFWKSFRKEADKNCTLSDTEVEEICQRTVDEGRLREIQSVQKTVGGRRRCGVRGCQKHYNIQL